jgi:hypothetical protein
MPPLPESRFYCIYSNPPHLLVMRRSLESWRGKSQAVCTITTMQRGWRLETNEFLQGTSRPSMKQLLNYIRLVKTQESVVPGLFNPNGRVGHEASSPRHEQPKFYPSEEEHRTVGAILEKTSEDGSVKEHA